MARHGFKRELRASDYSQRPFRSDHHIEQVTAVEVMIERIAGAVFSHPREMRVDRFLMPPEQRLHGVPPPRCHRMTRI